jgi:hypothetical protein
MMVPMFSALVAFLGPDPTVVSPGAIWDPAFGMTR